MTRPIRLALLGKSGSGKSRAGEFLSQHLGVEHLKTGFVCRQISRLLFANEDKGSTQLLDDALTPIDPCIFLRATLRHITDNQGFVVDALRFHEDLVLAREYGCRVVKIVAPEDMRLQRLVERGQAFDPAIDGEHRSETELDNVLVDYEVANDSDIAALERVLSRIVAEVSLEA